MDEPKKKPNFFLRLLALLVTLALVLGALVLVVYRDRYNLDALKRWAASRSVETGEGGQARSFTHGGGDHLTFACLGDGVMMASSAGMRYYSLSGQLYAEEVTSMEHPVLMATASAGAAYDAGGASLYLCQRGEESFTLTLEGDGDLLSARLNSSGWLAVTAQESGYKGSVTVYDSGHQRIFRLNRSSTFVVDAAVSPDCKSVAVVTMGQSGGAFQSELLVYPLNSEKPSVRLSLGNLAVLDLDYETDQIWVLGEDALMSVKPDGSDSSVYSFGHSFLKGCSFSGDGFALILLGRYRAGSADEALSIGPDAQVTARLGLAGQVLSFSAAGRYLCLLTGSELDIYTPDMALYRSLADTQGARYAALSSNASVLLADRQRAWMYIPN